MMRALPDALERFFEASSRSFDRLYRPAWLLSEVADPVWQIRFGESIREVDGVIKGATSIRWSLVLPDGRLTDPSHRRLLEHAKLLFVAAFDGGTSSSKTLAMATTYHRNLVWLVEYWVTHGPGLHLQQGLLGLDADSIETFLSIYSRSGVAGTSRVCERWDEWIFSLVERDKLELELATAALAAHERERLFFTFETKPGDPSAGLDCRPEASSIGRYGLARLLLHRMNAYDARGTVRARFVEEAIGIEASRVRRIAAFEVHLRRYEVCRDYGFRALPRVGLRVDARAELTRAARSILTHP